MERAVHEAQKAFEWEEAQRSGQAAAEERDEPLNSGSSNTASTDAAYAALFTSLLQVWHLHLSYCLASMDCALNGTADTNIRTVTERHLDILQGITMQVLPFLGRNTKTSTAVSTSDNADRWQVSLARRTFAAPVFGQLESVTTGTILYPLHLLLQEAYAKTFDDDSRGIRNSLIALLSFLLESKPFCTAACSAGLVRLLGDVIQKPDWVGDTASKIARQAVVADGLDHEHRRLLWSALAVACERSTECCSQLVTSNFMKILLLYVDLDTADSPVGVHLPCSTCHAAPALHTCMYTCMQTCMYMAHLHVRLHVRLHVHLHAVLICAMQSAAPNGAQRIWHSHLALARNPCECSNATCSCLVVAW